ncbi:hypothetical protein [Flavobacterium tructae]|uniref:hypothetical protein n=1 Tax=Flavobacterium tructae TaxID=1114873 RepID=UPI0035A942B8
MIQVEDKNGKNITVTDLTQAIEQADYFRNFAHADKIFEKFDKERQVYWQDLYEKLIKISNVDVKQIKK